MEFVALGQWHRPDEFRGAVDALERQFAEGDRGIFQVTLPFDAAAVAGIADAAARAAGAHLWEPVYADGRTLNFPFVKRPPQLLLLLAVITGIALIVIVAITIYKAVERASNLLPVVLALLAAAVVIPIVLRGGHAD